jgi:hypothetical protein
MSSAYTSAFGGVEPKYTTWKIREDGEHKQILDYIFHSKDRLQVGLLLTKNIVMSSFVVLRERRCEIQT